jgi:hypothetical protein
MTMASGLASDREPLRITAVPWAKIRYHALMASSLALLLGALFLSFWLSGRGMPFQLRYAIVAVIGVGGWALGRLGRKYRPPS